MRLLILALLVSCATAVPPAGSTVAPAPKPKPALVSPGLRLPPGARPLEYALELTVLPGQDRFSGTITATITIDQPLEVLWLNATDLKLEPTQLKTTLGPQPADPVIVDGNVFALVPRCAGCLIATGTQDVTLAFSGELSRKETDGLFQSKEGGEWYAFTSFEPIDARRAFPHFDEPQFKVPWTISLVVKNEHVALANSPQTAEEPLPNGQKRVRFSKSPPLPSYLVAVAAGPFEFVDGGLHGQKKTPVRIVTPKGKAAEAKYAAETTGIILERLEAWFGSPYPYAKLDQIAIPANIGAMENPGLVTYGHQHLLAKPEADSPGRQRGFAGICTHELAHQWFGDLVTMSWWDDLWLNEAFATWMTPRILEAWQPDWAMDVSEVNRRHGAIGSDSLVTARRIRQPIVSNDDIANAFDGITYGKGASVIAMFEAYVGRERFQKGVRTYLERFAWKNATASDFLSALSEAAERDVMPLFESFLDQPGAPVITVALECPKKAPVALVLEQRRALPVGSTGDATKTWRVPVCVRWGAKGKSGRACTVLESATARLELPEAKACPDWVLPNDGFVGYYRSNVKGVGLASTLEKAGRSLSRAERIGALGDLSALVRSGDIELGSTLSLAEPLAKETDRHVLGYALGFAGTAGGDLLPENLRPKHEAFVRSLFEKRLEALGFSPKPNEDEDTRLLRPQVIGVLGWHGRSPALLKRCRELAEAWLTDRKAIHPDVIDAVLGLAGASADAAFHARVLAAARTEGDRTDRVRLLAMLSQTNSRELVEQNLALVLTDGFEIREAMRLLWGAAGDFRTRATAFSFVEKNWEGLIARLPKDAGAGLVWVSGGACDEKERDAARAFFEGRSTKYLGGPRVFAQAMEGIDLCVAWRARHRASAATFFEKRR